MGGAKLNPSNLCRANTKIFNLIEYKETIPKLAYTDRGRDSTLNCAAPPSEPDWRISRIRLSGWWFYLV